MITDRYVIRLILFPFFVSAVAQELATQAQSTSASALPNSDQVQFSTVSASSGIDGGGEAMVTVLPRMLTSRAHNHRASNGGGGQCGREPDSTSSHSTTSCTSAASVSSSASPQDAVESNGEEGDDECEVDHFGPQSTVDKGKFLF